MADDPRIASLDARLRRIELLLNTIVLSDKYFFNKDISLKEGARIIPIGAGGLRFGIGNSSKFGFYGVTPVDRPATVSDPPLAGSVAGSDTVNAATVLANDQSLETAIEGVIDTLQELGLMQ